MVANIVISPLITKSRESRKFTSVHFTTGNGVTNNPRPHSDSNKLSAFGHTLNNDFSLLSTLQGPIRLFQILPSSDISQARSSLKLNCWCKSICHYLQAPPRGQAAYACFIAQLWHVTCNGMAATSGLRQFWLRRNTTHSLIVNGVGRVDYGTFLTRLKFAFCSSLPSWRPQKHSYLRHHKSVLQSRPWKRVYLNNQSCIREMVRLFRELPPLVSGRLEIFSVNWSIFRITMLIVTLRVRKCLNGPHFVNLTLIWKGWVDLILHAITQ